LTKKLHILFLCSWFPSRVLPTNGDFILRHAEAVATKHKVTAIHVITDEKLKSNIEVVMLTGDHEKSASFIAKELGIKSYKADMSPEDKAAFVQKHQDKVRVMVGDGVNDILALAHANIGISMGSGSDIAIDVSDVVLLNDSLVSLKEAFVISKRTFTLVKQNLGISLVYNLITIPLAMAGYIIPLIAAISMSFSSLLVVGNSIRIKWKWNR